MSFIFSRALEAAFSPDNFSDTEQSAPLSGSPTPKPCLWHDKTMEPSRLSRFGMTCKPLTDDHGAALLTLWLAGFRARTSALPEKVRDLMASAAECGTTWPASLAKYDPASRSLKTAQLSLVEDLTGCSLILPRSGLMRNGECWERPMLGRSTSVNGSGFWATPAASDATRGGTITPNMTGQSLVQMVNTPTHWPTSTVCGNYNRKGASKNSGTGLATAVAMSSTMNFSGDTDAPTAKAKMYPTATATACKGWSPNHNRSNSDDRLDYTIERQGFQPGQQTPPMRLNPAWVEWLMGWPIGHTELKPLGTDRFREWRLQHGECLGASE